MHLLLLKILFHIIHTKNLFEALIIRVSLMFHIPFRIFLRNNEPFLLILLIRDTFKSEL